MTEPVTIKSYCRICHALCGTEVQVLDNRIVQVRGDKSDPLSRGYACFKGLQAKEQHYGEGRLTRSLKRMEDGSFVAGGSDDLLEEAGQRLQEIIAEHGPSSVALFLGTQSSYNTLDAPLSHAFAAALGTHQIFATMTIDQSAKWVAEERMGTWHAGPQSFLEADVWLLVGANPMVSMVGAAGPTFLSFSNPVKLLKDAKARGTKIIIIDPRRSETAEFADVFVQPKPGQDAKLLACILHVVLAKGWHDQAFCDEYVEDLEALRQALAPFVPESHAQEIGLDVAEIEGVAAAFARDGRVGMAGSGTGPNMARHSNLAEHMIQALNAVCGRFPRAGDTVANPNVLKAQRPRYAEVTAPKRPWERGPKSREHGLGGIRGTMMSATLCDEILFSGEGAIKALICIGGNPAMALPDRDKIAKAFSEIDLLICVDPRMTATSRFAHYIFAPTLQYERHDHTAVLENMLMRPYAAWAAPVVPPPEGADVVHDWYVLWHLARTLGIRPKIGEFELPIDRLPKVEELLEVLIEGGAVSAEEVRRKVGGTIFDGVDQVVQPKRKDAKFHLVPDDVADELRDLAAEGLRNMDADLQLIVRRHREVINSTGADYQATRSRFYGSPAYLSPEEMQYRGLSAGDRIEISRGANSIHAIVAADAKLRPGILSMSHSWPGIPDRTDEATNILVDPDEDAQAINRMPVMTGFSVSVRKMHGGEVA